MVVILTRILVLNFSTQTLAHPESSATPLDGCPKPLFEDLFARVFWDADLPRARVRHYTNAPTHTRVMLSPRMQSLYLTVELTHQAASSLALSRQSIQAIG